MRTANQLTFTTYETSLKLKPNDPIKIIFENINWSFIHPLVQGKYSALPQSWKPKRYESALCAVKGLGQLKGKYHTEDLPGFMGITTIGLRRSA